MNPLPVSLLSAEGASAAAAAKTCPPATPPSRSSKPRCGPGAPLATGRRLLGALLLCSVSAGAAAELSGVRNEDGGQRATRPSTNTAEPAGFGPLDPSPPPNGVTPEAIIARFGERETAFAKARDEFTFRQTVKVETLAEDTGKPDGIYQQTTDIVFSDNGRRTERVLFAPANTLARIMMTQADFDDIAHRLPFVLTTPELGLYTITYLGRQRVDEIDTFVFDARPRTLEKGKRYFQGKVWVDQLNSQIVLINGKSVPDDLRRGHEDLSPPYTTYYAEVDGNNWFPVYTKADGVLHFPAQTGALSQEVHIRYTVKYEDYRRFRAKSRILFNGEELPTPPPAAPTPPKP